MSVVPEPGKMLPWGGRRDSTAQRRVSPVRFFAGSGPDGLSLLQGIVPCPFKILSYVPVVFRRRFLPDVFADRRIDLYAVRCMESPGMGEGDRVAGFGERDLPSDSKHVPCL